MDNNQTWSRGKMDFKFEACSGAVFDDIPAQMDLIGQTSKFMTVHIGGNDLKFSDLARACIYQPYVGDYGPDYSEDTKRMGECAKQID